MNTTSSPENATSPDKPPKLLGQVVERIRVKHYSKRTEQAYVHWIKRYIFFHDKRHPQQSILATDCRAVCRVIALDSPPRARHILNFLDAS